MTDLLVRADRCPACCGLPRVIPSLWAVRGGTRAGACGNRPRPVGGGAGGSRADSAVLRLLRRKDRLRGRPDLRAQFGSLVELEQRCRVLHGHDDGNRAVVSLDDGSLALDQGRVDVVAQPVAGRLDSDGHFLNSLAHMVSVQTDQTFRKACRSGFQKCKVWKVWKQPSRSIDSKDPA